jgi:hypothetical protein
MIRMVILAAIVVIIMLSAQRACAGPPFVTDDPEPVELHHWEVYLFSIYNHTAGSDAAQIPAIEVNYGAIPDVQLHLITPGVFDRPAGGSAEYGYGDTELGIKYRFVHETDYLPQIGTFPLVELPTGDSGRGLGNGQTQVFVPIWLQKSFGPDRKWTAYGGGGFWYNPGPEHRNYFRMGLELQRDLSEHLTLGGEIYHETPMAAQQPGMAGMIGHHESVSVIGEHGHTAFNLGGYYNFDEHRHLLFSAGRDIDGPNRLSIYLGFQLTF